MTDTGSIQLPNYDKPPVIEVVCSAQFEPINNFQATHYGLLQKRFLDEYPKIEQQPPLAQMIEKFKEGEPEEQQLQISNLPPLPRVFFVHSTSNWLIQIQPDRFIHNWRKTDDNYIYPRFDKVFDKFWAAWESFLSFCEDEKLDNPVVNQLEVTYINHMVQGQGWSGLSAMSEVFPDLSWRKQHSFLGTPESIAWKTSFVMPDESGRLHVSIRHALQKKDRTPVLLCELTARGMPTKASSDSIREWFKLGREWIVKGFADLTSEQMQKETWGRQE